VTRLCEFLPNGRLLSLGSFIKITEVAPYFGILFFQSIAYVLILTKIGWATFWGVFLQTHLVALAESQVLIATSPQNKNLVIRSLCLACCHEWQTQP
jgi:hypothetical protein